jgi:hypothetical protein
MEMGIRSKRKNTVTSRVANKKMSPEVYKLRRLVMAVIYDTKKIVDLPRIEVRITENKDKLLGVGRMKDNVIWIVERCTKMSEAMLRHVVVHEIGHAVYGLEHNEKCPVMKSIVDKPATKKQIEKFLKKVGG